MTKNNQDLRLLPFYFKKIAFGILIFIALLIILTKSKALPIDIYILETILKTGILLSFLLLALSKNKIEDELTLRIRLNAYAISFGFGVLNVIIEPFLNLFSNDDFVMTRGATSILTLMFLFYFTIFHYMLKKR